MQPETAILRSGIYSSVCSSPLRFLSPTSPHFFIHDGYGLLLPSISTHTLRLQTCSFSVVVFCRMCSWIRLLFHVAENTPRGQAVQTLTSRRFCSLCGAAHVISSSVKGFASLKCLGNNVGKSRISLELETWLILPTALHKFIMTFKFVWHTQEHVHEINACWKRWPSADSEAIPSYFSWKAVLTLNFSGNTFGKLRLPV